MKVMYGLLQKLFQFIIYPIYVSESLGLHTNLTTRIWYLGKISQSSSSFQLRTKISHIYTFLHTIVKRAIPLFLGLMVSQNLLVIFWHCVTGFFKMMLWVDHYCKVQDVDWFRFWTNIFWIRTSTGCIDWLFLFWWL